MLATARGIPNYFFTIDDERIKIHLERRWIWMLICWMPRRIGCNPQRCERSEARSDTHIVRITSASCMQSRRDAAEDTEAARADLEAAIVERYRCRESSVEQTWIGTYHGGGISLDVNVIIDVIAPPKRRWPASNNKAFITSSPIGSTGVHRTHVAN